MSDTDNTDNVSAAGNEDMKNTTSSVPVYENPADVESVYCEIDLKNVKTKQTKLSTHKEKSNDTEPKNATHYSMPSKSTYASEEPNRSTNIVDYENTTEVHCSENIQKKSQSRNTNTEVSYTNEPSVIGQQSSSENPSKVHHRTYFDLLLSFEGILFVLEAVCSLLSWILLVSWNYADMPNYRMPCPLGYCLFAFVTFWIITTCWFILLLVKAYEKHSWMKTLQVPPCGMFYNIICLLAYFIAGIIAGSFAVNDTTQLLGATTAFAFILVITHTAHALVYFRRQFGKCPCQYLPGCQNECAA